MSSGCELTVLFDFKDPSSYLALEPIRLLIEATGVRSHWYPFLGNPMRVPEEPGKEADRGALHRWYRSSYQARDLCRYAEARGLPARHFHDWGLYRQCSAEVAAMGFNWATGAGPDAARAYLDRVFEGYWDGTLDLDALPDIEQMLFVSGAEADGFDAYCQGEGLEELAAQREVAVAAGGFATPGCLLDGEAFIGRQHMPYLEKRLRDSMRKGAGT